MNPRTGGSYEVSTKGTDLEAVIAFHEDRLKNDPNNPLAAGKCSFAYSRSGSRDFVDPSAKADRPQADDVSPLEMTMA